MMTSMPMWRRSSAMRYARPSVEAIISPAKRNSITALRLRRMLLSTRGADLFEHHAVGHVEIAGAQGEGFHGLLGAGPARQVEGVQDDGGSHADHDEHDLGQFIDAEGDEEDGQQGERDDLIEEQDEAQEERSDIREQSHVQAQQDGGKKQNHAVKEAARSGLGVFPEHAAEERCQLTCCSSSSSGLHGGVVHAARPSG